MRILKNRLGGQVGKVCSFKMNSENLIVADVTFDNNFLPEDNNSEIGNITKNLQDLGSDISELE